MMTCFLFLPPKVLLRSVVLLGLFFVSVRAVEEREDSIGRDAAISCELGKMLHSLLTPTEIQSLQVQALRQELFRILLNVDEEEMKLIRYDEEHDNNEDFDAHKRSLASLARTGSIRYSKRNIEALARAGILKVPPQDKEFDYKRSIATLAKNGQLPNYSIPEDNSESENENDDEEVKRSIEALARNGYLNQKRQQLTDLLNALTEDKRNIGSLARGFSLPSGKRNIASLAREYSLPFYGKRFLGSLARSGDLRTKKDYYDEMEDEKRNLASIVRNSGKRFIGALARNGDLRSKKDDLYDDEKRNIGSFMRNNEFPYAGKRYNYYEEFKRNIGSIAKGMSGRFVGKRNVAALLRQDNYLNGHRRNDIRSNRAQNDELNDDMKRNIASLKAQMKKRSVDINQNMSRTKREIDYPDNSDSDEYSVPVYQNSDGYDYEEMMQALNGAELPDKRFLGRLPDMGVVNRPKTTPQTVGGR